MPTPKIARYTRRHTHTRGCPKEASFARETPTRTHQILLLSGEFELIGLVSKLRFPPGRRADPTDPVPLGVRPDGRDVLQRLGELRRRGVVAGRLVDPFQGGVAG